MTQVQVFVDRPEERTLTFECEMTPSGLEVPRLTRQNVAQLIFWLFEFDPEAGPEKGGSTIPFLLDDLMQLLLGGVFSIAYPTDYGKSTLVDADTVVSLILWPEETLNIIIKRAVEAAVAAAISCAFMLLRASEYFPYARPLCRWDVQTGLPQVKGGYFIEGCRLRTRGERNRSVFPAGIASTVVQGMRGRTKLDDLEDENLLKSEAKTDTLRKQVNNSVRNFQASAPGVIPLWSIFGTAQGDNSVMFVVNSDLSDAGMVFRRIERPQFIQDGPHKGERLFPARAVKSEMQKGIMDPTAYDISYNLRIPGQGRFDAETALRNVMDPRLPYIANERDLTEYLYWRTAEDTQRHVGINYSNMGQLQQAVYKTVSQELGIYANWDPATVGTYAVALIAMLPKTRWLLRVVLGSATADEQADKLLSWQKLFPSLTIVVERDGTQDAFIDILRIKDPSAMIVPHQTHGFNQKTRHVGLPAMMREMLQPNCWHFPEIPEDDFTDYPDLNLERLQTEIRRWGPSSHPHAIPALWFGWVYDKNSRLDPDFNTQDQKDRLQNDQVEILDVVVHSSRPLQDPFGWPQPAKSASQIEWERRL